MGMEGVLFSGGRAAALGLLTAFCLVVPAGARPLLKPDPDSDAELQDAKERLADIQRRIDAGDLPKIQFDFDSAKLRPESEEVIDLIAEMMLDNPQLKLMVFAHTCNMGAEQYNLDLSQRRAKSVKTALVKRGIPPPSVRYRGLGFEKPVADNDTEEGREKNRRVEFHVMRRWWSSIY